MKTVTQAFRSLNDHLLELDSLVQSFDLLSGDQPPPWVYVLQRRMEALLEASEGLDMAIGGYGGSNPHVDTPVASSVEPSRPAPSITQGSDRGSEKLSSLAFE